MTSPLQALVHECVVEHPSAVQKFHQLSHICVTLARPERFAAPDFFFMPDVRLSVCPLRVTVFFTRYLLLYTLF